MADRKRKASKPYIPGLVEEAYIEGSQYSAPTPKLTHHQVHDNGQVEFQWEAKGSLGTYTIEAKGKVEVVFSEENDEVMGRGLNIKCSCPDGERQAAAMLKDKEGRIIVCKHGAAALESVLDEAAQAALKAEREEHKKERIEKAARRREEEKKAKQEQEKRMPGEHARIKYGLDALNADDVKKLVENALKTLDGLAALAVVFPSSIMPSPETKYCVRCNKTYDPRYASQKVCRVEHPDQRCHTEWDGSKKSWQHCSRCGGDFNLNGFHSWDRNAPYDDGEWCFEGEHTQDEELVQDEDWEGDGDDY